uniref:protein-serine/threonine phosphatase n=1 Tax=Zea mays TaxID=4577 RepID=A0A804N8G2_MAIZE
MTGYEMLKRVKESAALRDILVVVMSSENVPTRITRCLEEFDQRLALRRSRRLDVVQSGCTALSIVKHGDLMVVANVDDSRVVLGITTYDDAITPSSSSST